MKTFLICRAFRGNNYSHLSPNIHHSIRSRGNEWIMSNHENSVPSLSMELSNEIHNPLGIRAIEIARWLIRIEIGEFTNKSSRYRYSLSLSSRELIWITISFAREPYSREYFIYIIRALNSSINIEW